MAQPNSKKGNSQNPETVVQVEQRDNRYLRAARAIIQAGEGAGIDPINLGMQANMSKATASHCLEAFKGVCTALREAGMLPPKVPPANAPTAPEKRAEPS